MKRKSMLIVAILLMSIGFAAVSTTLVINGNAKVSENEEDFSVIFTAASIDGKDVYSTVIDDTKKIITFETSELKTLNQTSILTYEVTNNSSNYDAEVSVTCVPKEGTTAKYTSIKNKLDNDATVVKAKETLNGTLTVSLEKTSTEEVSEEYTCKLEFNAVERDTIADGLTQFGKDSWSIIAANVKSGNTSKYNIGDTKEVDLGDLGTHMVRISNMSACTTETSETACGFVVEFADIITEQQFNSNGTNEGGWKDSEIRIYVNETIYNALPGDLQNVIVTTKVISGYGPSDSENFETQDKLYLLSGHEVYENGKMNQINESDTAYNDTKQLDYYKNQGVVTDSNLGTAKKYLGVSRSWWLRSSHLYGALGFFAGTYIGTGETSNYFGVSPAFRIA